MKNELKIIYGLSGVPESLREIEGEHKPFDGTDNFMCFLSEGKRHLINKRHILEIICDDKDLA